ncbi:chitin elicitor receptor kinase 1-like [Panicum miliaceum]|uniref:Chitin elicitor receptor kinase 1-like n=1 Tax=Panicum miliaceum TaxID=4540 RepID=A0A3L6TSQ7_PANMI|nr:chitin elicitor receptor kinase 1-like [Panicum miliaceum]
MATATPSPHLPPPPIWPRRRLVVLYLAYEFPQGAATLAACLRGPWNHSFTVRSSPTSARPNSRPPPTPGREAGESPYAAPGSSEPSWEANVYAFGKLLLELLSGQEPVRYCFDRGTKDFQRVSVLKTVMAVATGGSVRN